MDVSSDLEFKKIKGRYRPRLRGLITRVERGWEDRTLVILIMKRKELRDFRLRSTAIFEASLVVLSKTVGNTVNLTFGPFRQ